MILQSLRKTLQEAQNTCFGTCVEIPLRESEDAYSSSLALQLAKDLGRPPLEIARELASALQSSEFQVWVTGPGFLNFRISDTALLTYFHRFYESPLPVIVPPKPQSTTLTELRDDLASCILRELGGKAPCCGYTVSSPLSLQEALSFLGENALYFALFTSPLQHPLLLQPQDIIKESLSNPWYYLCHSYVKLTCITRDQHPLSDWETTEPLSSAEKALIREIVSLPEANRSTKFQSDPYFLSRYTLKLARLFDELFSKKRIPLPTERNDSMKLRLALATRNVLGHVLIRFGITMPLEL